MEIIASVTFVLLVISLALNGIAWNERSDLARRLACRTEERDDARRSLSEARAERHDAQMESMNTIERTAREWAKVFAKLARLVPAAMPYVEFGKDGPRVDIRAIDRDTEALETADRVKRAAELRPAEPHGPVFKDCHWGFDPAHDGPIGVFYFETEAVKEARAVPLPLFFVSRTLAPGSKKKTRFGLATVVGPKSGKLEGLRGTIVLSIDWNWTLTSKQSAKAYDTLRRNRAKGARVVWPSGNEVAL